MAREASFTFVSEDLIDTNRFNNVEYRVSLLKRTSKAKKPDGSIYEFTQYVIYFPKDVIWVYDLKGKKLKFYVDRLKKTIGWRVIKEATTLEEMSTARTVNPSPNGSWTVSISKLMTHLGIDTQSRTQIPVKKYQTTELSFPRTYYYIEL